MSSKNSIDDIFDDDEFGLLNARKEPSRVKTDDDRLVDSFEEINTFFDKNCREPGQTSMSEYGLSARLKNFRQDEDKKKILKPFDRHDLLGYVEIQVDSVEDILREKNDMLETEEDLSIFEYRNIPKTSERAEAEYIAQRKPMKEKEFKKYEAMFQQVHIDIKEGKRSVKPFTNIEKNLHVGNYYFMDGLLLYLESAALEKSVIALNSGDRYRVDGRTRTIFENSTYSNMLYRSLGKQIQKDGQLVTNINAVNRNGLFVDEEYLTTEDVPTGWIYVLKSKSKDQKIASITNLYKIGFTSTPIVERLKNAANEPTYLYADVQVIATYKCYNRNADKLELLLHRFFASACLNVDLYNEKGLRLNPREWFVVPFQIIEQAIEMILDESILDYKYDIEKQRITLK